MARVLLAWEFGANLGHVARIRALARALQDQGHSCQFAASDLRGTEEFMEPALGPVYQAPVRIGGSRNPVGTQVSYASLLNNSGYDDITGLASRLRGWRSLLSLLRPQVVIGDHAPTALLAARSLGVPCALVGTGFTVPPVRQPFPVFQPGMQVAPEVLARNEMAVLVNLNRALQRLQLPPLEKLQDIFQGVSGHVLSYAELDHYAVARSEPYLGVPDNAHGAAPQWPAGDGPRLLAYLRPSKSLEAALTGLQRSKARVLLRTGEIAADKLKPFLRPGLAITDRPVNMRLAAQDCDAFINYASHGFTAEMLLAGKPGLLLPDHLERGLVARRSGQLGATLTPPPQKDFNLSEALQRIVEDPSLRRAAEGFAARYRTQDRQKILPQLAEQVCAGL